MCCSVAGLYWVLQCAGACLRCSGHNGTFSAHCVQCNQVTNHSTRAQYLCFELCTHYTSTHTAAKGEMIDCLVNIAIKRK